MRVEGLTEPVTGVAEALDVVSGFDDGLTQGFARVGEERAGALSALAGAFAATPLGDRMAETVAKVAAGSVGEDTLAALAGGRAAVLGAVHDALLARLDETLGRSRAPWEPVAAGTAPLADNLLAGCRSWLTELAVTGWRGVDHDLVVASAQMTQALLVEPGLRRLAVLLDGMAAELRACCPLATMPRIPVRRWADLWTRAMLLAQPGGLIPATPTGTLSGRLLPLGVDLHEHGTAVQAQVHAVVEPAGGGPARLVRVSVGAAKVDTIVGPALWRLLGAYPVLLGALAEGRAVELAEVPVLASGDLLWTEERAKPGEPADPFVTARLQVPGALAASAPPLDRHPVGIAEPVLLTDYAGVTGDEGAIAFDFGGGRVLAVDADRLPSAGPLTRAQVAASTACIALLRWDAGRWSAQPLAVQAVVKKKAVAVHGGAWALGPTDPKAAKSAAATGDAVAVLRERAGRLLRK